MSETKINRLSAELRSDLQSYIDAVYRPLRLAHPCGKARPRREAERPAAEPVTEACLYSRAQPDLAQALEQLDEGFSKTLLRLIDQRGMTDAECYQRAQVDRRLFSKIRSDPAYRPSKPTAVAFALALRLSTEEARALLAKAGFALSHASKFDIIIEYFLDRRVYDVDTVNAALYEFDQTLLGAK